MTYYLLIHNIDKHGLSSSHVKAIYTMYNIHITSEDVLIIIIIIDVINPPSNMVFIIVGLIGFIACSS